MLLTQFKPLRGLEETKTSKRKRVLSPKQKQKRNITQRQMARAPKFLYMQPEVGDMKINAMPPWAHPKRANPSLSSYIRGSSGYAPYVGKGKIFRSSHNSQVG